MALAVYSLASGSSGNSILVRDGHSAILIDAGIGIRKLVLALEKAHTNPADLSGILISHEHSDHIAGAVRMARRYGVPLISNAETLSAIAGAEDVRHKVLSSDEDMLFGDLAVRSFPISHDAAKPVGYSICSSGGTVCSATDIGVLTPDVRTAAAEADLLILESNHDVEMLMNGPYPWYLKRRIVGDRGHLSNESASRLLVELARRGRKTCVWLAHLSGTNNSPAMALRTARQLLSDCHESNLDVDVALRDVPSLCWSGESPAFQMSLFNPASG